MVPIIIFSLFLSFFLWMRYQDTKSKRRFLEEHNAFWEKERSSNSTRKTDISNLDYIKIPINCLPFIETTDEKLHLLQLSIKELSDKRILDLTGLSNTDLKLKYGVANINILSEYENNYTKLIQTLYQWGSYLYDHNNLDDAIQVLEYGIQCKTDISKHYILLANIYKQMNVPAKIDSLIASTENMQSLLKGSIQQKLEEIKLSIY